MSERKFRLVFTLPGVFDSTRAHAVERAACRRLVEGFVRLFHGDDDVCLGVLCARESDLLDVARWYEDAARLHPFGAPPQVELELGNPADAGRWQGAMRIDAETEWDVATLQQAYLAFVACEDVNAYEGAEISDFYDLELVAERRRFTPTYEGSIYANTTRAPRYRELFAWLAAHDYRARILDVGCGAGATYGLLRRLCARLDRPLPLYTGLDHSRSHIFRARSLYPEAHFVWGSAACMAWPRGAFDVAVANSVLNFIPVAPQLETLRRLLEAAEGRVLTALTALDPRALPPGPSNVAQRFHDVRVLWNHFAPAAAIRALVSAWPACELVEEPTLVGLRPDPDASASAGEPALWVRELSTPDELQGLRLAHGDDVDAVADAFRAAHGLAQTDVVFEAVRLELWPQGARDSPSPPELPDDLHAEPWGPPAGASDPG
jgi:SAM-dependent methyltransferase